MERDRTDMGDILSDYLEKLTVWEKGHIVPGLDPAVWRKDDYDNLIRWSDYGDRDSDYGWEIDHQFPSALGGLDVIGNKRPLHCKANAWLGGLLGGLFK